MTATRVRNYFEVEDEELVDWSVGGDKLALQNLVGRYQNFVFNLSLKFFGRHQEAEDTSQEIWIKVITGLSTFRKQSKFSTWLYRLTANALLDTKRSARELSTTTFEDYFSFIANVPDATLTDDEKAEQDSAIEELKINCTAGMILCLERKQRLAFILGEIFSFNHKTCAKILKMSPENFRVVLCRARKDLYQWMNNKCGLVNKNNPCRCHKKTRGFIRAGIVDPKQLRFNTGFTQKIFSLAKESQDRLVDTVEALNQQHYAETFRDQPFQQSTNESIVKKVINNATINNLFFKGLIED